MRKLKLFSVLATGLLLVAACSKNDSVTTEETLPQANSRVHFFGLKASEATRGVARYDHLWLPGSTIKVKFLNGSATLQNLVQTYAAQWEEYANIHFDFVTSGDAPVRIGFDWNDNRWVTWSYIGNDCLSETDQGEATLSFADFEYYLGLSNGGGEDTMRGEVLRAFGLVLGLELENRHPDFDGIWSSRRGYTPKDYWEENITDVAWAEIQAYVFDQLERGDNNTLCTPDDWDSESIMNWPFTTGVKGVLIDGPGDIYDLSEGDKDFIASLYPGKLGAALASVAGDRNSITFNTGANVRWAYNAMTDRYDLRGDAGTVTSIAIDRTHISYLDVSGLTYLKKINLLRVTGLTSLSLYSNPLLEEVAINLTPLTTLTLPAAAPNLTYFSCKDCDLTSLNLSGCTALTYVWCEKNPFIANATALQAVANSLPNRSGLSKGYLMLGINANASGITGICTSKNWEAPAEVAKITCGYNLTVNGLGYAGSYSIHYDDREYIHHIAGTVVTLWAHDISYLDVSGCSSLERLSLNGVPCLNSLSLAGCTSLKFLYAAGANFLQNPAAAISFANSICSTGGAIDGGAIRDVPVIANILASKGWRIL